MPRRTFLRGSSVTSLVVAGLAGAVGSLPLLVVACSSFDAATPAADGNGGELDAGPTEAAAGDATAPDASSDGDAACGDLLGPDFLKGGWTLAGSATNMGNFVLALTDAIASQGGLASHVLDLAPMQSFHASFTLRVTTTDVAAADGVTFFWSGDAQPLIGGAGNLLGYCNGVNGGAVALVTTLVVGDSGVPRSSVVVKHDQPGSCVDDGPVATTAALAAVDAGTVSAAIEIYLDGPAAKISVRRDGMTVIDRQQLGYVPERIRSIGFTAATGANYAAHAIKDFKLTSCR